MSVEYEILIIYVNITRIKTNSKRSDFEKIITVQIAFKNSALGNVFGLSGHRTRFHRFVCKGQPPLLLVYVATLRVAHNKCYWSQEVFSTYSNRVDHMPRNHYCCCCGFSHNHWSNRYYRTELNRICIRSPRIKKGFKSKTYCIVPSDYRMRLVKVLYLKFIT